MGVAISQLVPRKEIELVQLRGKRVAIDAFNTIFQFLSVIRDRMTGEPLKDHKGRVTSHLSGLLYRTTNMLDAGIRPVYVFDGKYPEFKKKTIEEREQVREQARKKWEEAVREGKPAMKYAQAASQMTGEILESSKEVLELMGIPWIQAVSEGEAQCSHMCIKGDVWATGSQDADSLLFGTPRLVRNLSLSGRKKVPNKEVYMQVKPELVELKAVLSSLGLTREQLIMLGLLIGTDYNEGVKGVGPKTALKLVKEHATLDRLLAQVEFAGEIDIERIYNFFLNPPYTDDYKTDWKRFMTEEHDFSRERMEKIIAKLEGLSDESSQTGLGNWLKK
jgi:flap endonuclease-1